MNGMNKVDPKDDEYVRPTISNKKRVFQEDKTVASALLSLDKGGQSPKRLRPSTPGTDAEARDATHVSTSNSEQRDSLDNSRDRDPSSPVASGKLSRRFASRFEVASSSRQDIHVTPKRKPKADPHELASAMALASLANQAQVQVSPNPHAHYAMYPPYLPMQEMMPCMHPSQAMYAHGNPHAAHYYHNMRYAYSPPAHAPPAPRPIDDNHNNVKSNNNWACDYCGQVSFSTYNEACNHEKTCPRNPNAARPSMTLSRPRLASRNDSMTSVMSQSSTKSVTIRETISSPADEDESKFFCGTVKLSVPAADNEWLSEMNCYIRSECIEAFSADDDDVFKSSKRGRIAVKQVGIRCIFCAKVDVNIRAMSAVSYPVSSSGIYESVKRWSKIHLPLCKHIPQEVKDKLAGLEKTAFVPTTRQYWIDSAKALGINDTRGGLRFTRDVTDSNNTEKASKMLLRSQSTSEDSATGKPLPESAQKSHPVVFPEDENVITPFLYALLRQLETCQFTDADRYIARSRCSTGFNGFQCRHCSGHAGLGKYFPTSPKALATNSTSQNIFSHVLKCRKCPDEIKEKLKTLKHDKGHWTRRTTGWRQKFFEEVWQRLHGNH